VLFRSVDLVNAPNATAVTAIGTGVWATTVRTLSTAGVQAIWDAATSALTTAGSIGLALVSLVGRIVGTLLTGNHSPQSGDTYAIANGDHGLVSIQDDVDTLLTDVAATHAHAAAAATDTTELLTRLLDVALTTGTVATAGGNNTASSFYTDLPGADNFWIDALILITSGALAGQVKKIGDFADANGVVTLATGEAFTGIPADGVTFAIINR
jgi:hypothetical protein